MFIKKWFKFLKFIKLRLWRFARRRSAWSVELRVTNYELRYGSAASLVEELFNF